MVFNSLKVCFSDKVSSYFSVLLQSFLNSGKGCGGGGIRDFAGGGEIFLPGEGNLRRSDFDQLKSKLSFQGV